MIKKSFFGLIKPKIEYDSLKDIPPLPENVATPESITLFIRGPLNQTLNINVGDKVKTGCKIFSPEGDGEYAISTVTGKVASISPFNGDYGKTFTAVSIDVSENDEPDENFSALIKNPSIENLTGYLGFVPGKPCVEKIADSKKPVKKIIVCGIDTDLATVTNQYILKFQPDVIKSGINILKKITGGSKIIMAAPHYLVHEAGQTGADEVKLIDSLYPAAIPKIMMKNNFGTVVPTGSACEDLGACFISAEAVASIGKVFDKGQIPTTKIFTLVKKDGTRTLVSAKIGTPLKEILSACKITTGEKDRIIFGGPMTGCSVYSENYPVLPDTDSIIIQDREDLTLVSDCACINCGECTRICPANIPINMLVRFLEAGQYEEAADQYDLFSCIECGLCSYVCVAQIPVLQYIKLAKYELGLVNTVEDTND